LQKLEEVMDDFYHKALSLAASASEPKFIECYRGNINLSTFLLEEKQENLSSKIYKLEKLIDNLKNGYWDGSLKQCEDAPLPHPATVSKTKLSTKKVQLNFKTYGQRAPQNVIHNFNTGLRLPKGEEVLKGLGIGLTVLGGVGLFILNGATGGVLPSGQN
jgi:hypothetical protein